MQIEIEWPKEESSDAEQIDSHFFNGLFRRGRAGGNRLPEEAGGRRPAPAMQGLPVQTVTVAMSPVAQSSEYVATIKSRRSATLQPQVSGSLTEIRVRSGDHVKAGQVMMEIDPRQQQATVESQRATERQKKALYDYDTVEVDRQQQAV